MEVIGGNLENHDQEFDEVRWIGIEKAKTILTFQSESDIINKILDNESKI